MFFIKLALGNLKKASQAYAPFIFSSVTLFVILNTINLIWLSPDIQERRVTPVLLKFAFWVIVVFATILVTYSHRFLLKQRSKEFGLYSVLGMNRRRIATIASLELMAVAGLVILSGMILATVLSQFLYLVLVNLIQIKTFELAIQPTGYYLSIIIFLCIFLGLIGLTWWHIQRSNSLALMNASKKGEKEPEGNLFLGGLGLILILGAYLFAITDSIKINDDYLTYCFLAVLAVIFGTYLVFISFTTWFLRKQKNRKEYFYKKKNFIPISQMLYRMKQNALGLGNITILSSMVMATLIGTASIHHVSTESVLSRYPEGKNTYINYIGVENRQVAETLSQDLLDQFGSSDLETETLLSFQSYELLKNEENLAIRQVGNMTADFDEVSQISFISQLDYEKITGHSLNLGEGEVGYYHAAFENDLKTKTITLYDDQTYQVKELSEINHPLLSRFGVENVAYIVLQNDEHLQGISKAYFGESSVHQGKFEVLQYNMLTQMDGEQYEKLEELFQTAQPYFFIQNKEIELEDSLNVSGTFIFIGAIIGISFFLGACLIMYFKQISEGYEDRKAYKVLQEIGMSQKMVKKTIRSQVLFIFFTPLLVSVCHISFASFIIIRLIKEVGMAAGNLLWLAASLIAGFSLLYFAIYWLTGRTYYKIIER